VWRYLPRSNRTNQHPGRLTIIVVQQNHVSWSEFYVGATHHDLNLVQIYDQRWTWFSWTEIWSTLVKRALKELYKVDAGREFHTVTQRLCPRKVNLYDGTVNKGDWQERQLQLGLRNEHVRYNGELLLQKLKTNLASLKLIQCLTGSETCPTATVVRSPLFHLSDCIHRSNALLVCRDTSSPLRRGWFSTHPCQAILWFWCFDGKKIEF